MTGGFEAFLYSQVHIIHNNSMIEKVCITLTLYIDSLKNGATLRKCHVDLCIMHSAKNWPIALILFIYQ